MQSVRHLRSAFKFKPGLLMEQDHSSAPLIFRLLIASPASDSPAAESIEIAGKHWQFVWFEQISDAPPFTCVSYSWGPDKLPNPFKDDEKISVRTIPVLETAIQASHSSLCWNQALAGMWSNQQTHADKLTSALAAAQAIWIDSLCMPDDPVAHKRCLLSMGAIYSAATQVIAVLASKSAEAFQKIRKKMPLEYRDLLAIENDDWISRVWTYQEIAGSQAIYFAIEADVTHLLNHQEFLNALVTATTDYADAEQISRNELVKLFPHLDSLQDVLTELQNVEYNGRSVFQILGAMQNRVAVIDADRLYAMLGVVSNKPMPTTHDADFSIAEYFMAACEEINDFSYLFSTSPRSNLPGKSWRPTGEQMNALVCGLATFGFGLSASVKETHLEMHNMCRMQCNVNNPVVTALSVFIRRSFEADILEQLRRRGFTGHGDCITLENGYFFPQSPLPPAKELKGLFVAISQGVLFAQGAPGVLLRPVGDDMNQFCDVGVFIGRTPNESMEINMC